MATATRTTNIYHKSIFYQEELNKFIYGKFPYDGKTQVTMNGNSLRVVCSFPNVSDRLQELVLQYFERLSTIPHERRYIVISFGDWDIGGFTADGCDEVENLR